MHVKQKISVLALIIFLSIMAVLSGSFGSQYKSSNSVVSITIPVLVDVTVPKDICSWALVPSEPGIFTKKEMMEVKANTKWRITVKDADKNTTGYMTEWNGSAYLNKRLKYPVKISAGLEVDLTEGGTIQTGTNTEGQEVEVTLTQVVSQEDLPLIDGHVYRIALNFEGSPINS